MQDTAASYWRRSLLAGIVSLSAVVIAVGIGLAVMAIQDATRPGVSEAGETDSRDRVTLHATLESVSAAQGTFTMRIWPTPHGKLANGSVSAADLSVSISGATGSDLVFRAGERLGGRSVTVEFQEGDTSRYPFDQHSVDIYFSVTAEGTSVPSELVFNSTDALYRTELLFIPDETEPGLRIEVSRSFGTFVMVTVMFGVMWALALAVAGAAVLIIVRRLGIVWPALGWMAATLFALSAFRGVAPGAPPIGVLLDYTAFLWAEVIVATSLVAVVVAGLAREFRNPAPS
ncbi:DUF4436 family protein (plasmid) [Microbacterium hominis]|uniref:DUF4436 family protein n=1 Tax=Microbacterium hominis TaxID=162426 RepID=UPI00196323AB|nr:DUF4436 family protein [Microbacterium hominis]QRY42335.1 DUF4436 family protein [Microbacterium hominis]